MIFAVNIGNTNIRAAIGESGADSCAVIPATGILSGKDFIKLTETRLGADIWARIDGSIVSSVVPGMTAVIAEAVEIKTGKAPQRIDTQMCGGINARNYGGLLGEDRAVCCAAALQKYGPPFILMDFGTATTINVVNGDGEFLGGAILAGVQSGLNALSEDTSQLPRLDVDFAVSAIGKSTKENLMSGAVVGPACMAGGYARRIEFELGRKLPVIITGGHARLILPYCDFEYYHEPDLLLDGLFALYKKN